MAQRRPANRTRLTAVTNTYPYVRCHVLRHNFEAVGPIPGGPRATFGTLITFRCEHCATIRYDVVSRLTGDLLHRYYDHPDDYKTDHQTMPQWRVQLMDEMDNALLRNLAEEEQA